MQNVMLMFYQEVSLLSPNQTALIWKMSMWPSPLYFSYSQQWAGSETSHCWLSANPEHAPQVEGGTVSCLLLHYPLLLLSPSCHKAPHTRRILSGLCLLYHPHISTMGWRTHITLFGTGVTGPLHGKLQQDPWFKEPLEYPHFTLSLASRIP